MIEQMTCREWYERTYKGIWSDKTLNDVKVVDEWRTFLMKNAVPEDFMTPEQLTQFDEWMRQWMSGAKH